MIIDGLKAVFEDYYGERNGIWVFYVKENGEWREAEEGKDILFKGIGITDVETTDGKFKLHIDLDSTPILGETIEGKEV